MEICDAEAQDVFIQHSWCLRPGCALVMQPSADTTGAAEMKIYEFIVCF